MENRISTRRAEMLIYSSPNFFLAIFGMAWAVKEFGWESLISLPYVILLIWLIASVIVVFAIRWEQAKEKTDSEKILDKLDEILTEIRDIKE